MPKLATKSDPVLVRLAVIEEKIDALGTHLDKIYGSVEKHDQWIASREERLEALGKQVELLPCATHQQFIAEEAGRRRTLLAFGAAVWGILSFAGAFVAHFLWSIKGK